MKMKFDYEKVDAIAKALGGRIEMLERLHAKSGLSSEDIEIIMNTDYYGDFFTIYGFHIDSNESDPSEAVTYLKDAVGFKPGYMDYSTGKFNYGSWEHAFFMPRPCMLKYDGTVDYYLNPNDYGKKEDGTVSDVANDAYAGNAMMEWGRDGHQIWYKIVPDEDDPTSTSVYFSDYKLDEGFHAWSFINNQGNLVNHFYTPIYNGSLDGDGKLRSLSEKNNTALCQNKTKQQEITAAELNNSGDDKLWYTEVFSDTILIDLLLILIGKSLDAQKVFGNGRTIKEYSPNINMIGTGTMDDKGLFFGSNDNVTGVKVFGIENFWGNQYRSIAGLMSVDRTVKYKFTYGSEDGSSAERYNTTAEGYLDANSFANNAEGYITKYLFTKDGGMFIDSFDGSVSTYYTDSGCIKSGINYAYRGAGSFALYGEGAFSIGLDSSLSITSKSNGAALSCKPLS